MVKNIHPSISVIIPAHNEEFNLTRLFHSLKSQNYPNDKIQYIVINDSSSDQTKPLAIKFGAKVVDVKTRDIELNKGIGMHISRSELIYWMDADMEVCDKNFFKKLTKPLVENRRIIGSFTNEFYRNKNENIDNSLLRFIAYDPLQRDPLYQFFSPSIESTITFTNPRFYTCIFHPGKIPPCGRIMYRRKELLRTRVGKNKSFIDLESLEIVSRAGYRLFAYVPQAKIKHYHATNLRMLIKKRLRNLENDYLPYIESKFYTWFNPENTKDTLRIFFWIIYANLVLPETIRGIKKALKYRDAAFFWQPLVSLLTTDAILWGFLSKPKGRKLAFRMTGILLGFKSQKQKS